MDRLLPDAPYRQWVLTFPWALRSRLACDRALFSRMLQVFLRTLFAWQRRRGRSLGIAGIKSAQTGSVSFIQRFTQDLRLFPHVHVVVPDGLFTLPDGGTELRFHTLPPPTDSDIRSFTERLSERLQAVALRHEAQHTDEEPVDGQEALIRSCSAAALQSPTARLAPAPPSHYATSKPLCASVAGFSLHAARTVAAHDRPGLERLCRYGLRAPFSVDRFSLTRDGRVRYELRKVTSTGRTELLLEPLDLLRRLVALLPAPYGNMVRYHGVFANRSQSRALLPHPTASLRATHGSSPLAGTKGSDCPGTDRPASGAAADPPESAPSVASPVGGPSSAPPRDLRPDEPKAPGPTPNREGPEPGSSVSLSPHPASPRAGSASSPAARRRLSWAALLL